MTRGQVRAGAQQGLWQPLVRDVLVWAGCADDLSVRCRGLALVLPPEAVVGGTTAAWLHGAEPLDGGDHVPLALVPAPTSTVPRRAGVRVRQAPLPSYDVVVLHGLRVTSPARTVLDVARTADLVEAVVVADALLHRGLVSPEQLRDRAAAMRRWRGITQARAVLGHAEPLSESPMESRLRMQLVLGGLPRPRAQVRIYVDGRLVARVDLGYEEARLLIEFDGRVSHTGDAFDSDRSRQNLLVHQLGYDLLRYTGPAVLRRSPLIVHQVGTALARAGVL